MKVVAEDGREVARRYRSLYADHTRFLKVSVLND